MVVMSSTLGGVSLLLAISTCYIMRLRRKNKERLARISDPRALHTTITTTDTNRASWADQGGMFNPAASGISSTDYNAYTSEVTECLGHGNIDSTNYATSMFSKYHGETLESMAGRHIRHIQV